MTTLLEERDFVREMRTRSTAEDGIVWTDDGELGVFDPDAAQKVNALNFSSLTLPDKLADLLRGRSGQPVSWKQVRAAWIAQLRRQSDAEGIRQLAARMGALLDQRLDRPLDLVWVAQEVCTQALLPIVVTGLAPTDTARILRDQTVKLSRLLTPDAARATLRQEIRTLLIQISAGLAVRRELRGRATGRRPRQVDLTDPVVDLLPVLGMDRAVDAVTTVLTAIAGPPGAVAACLLYELTRRPDWAARLTSELAAAPATELYRAPTRVAPVTYRFVKETLRMWSAPLFMTRAVRTPLKLEQAHLQVGQHYFVSPYLIHHDHRHWNDPDVFDPDRWLPAAAPGGCPGAPYVPFGWPPTTCIGAGLGTTQLIVLCHLMCTQYRIEVAAPDTIRMLLAAVALPRNFYGTITRR